MRKNYPNNCFFPTGESCPGSGPVCPILFRCGAPLPRGFRLFSQVQYSKIHFFLPAIKYMHLHILRHQSTSHFFSRVFASPGKGCLVENGAGPPSKTEQCGCTVHMSPPEWRNGAEIMKSAQLCNIFVIFHKKVSWKYFSKKATGTQSFDDEIYNISSVKNIILNLYIDLYVLYWDFNNH